MHFPVGGWHRQAALFGGLLVFLETTVLLLGANRLAAAVALATFGLYVFVYASKWTTLNTVIGAVPWQNCLGHCGWPRPDAVGRGSMVVVPDRVSLAVSPLSGNCLDYRDDYQRAGFRMLTAGDPTGDDGTVRQSPTLAQLSPRGWQRRSVWRVRFILPARAGLVYFDRGGTGFWFEASDDRRARRLLRAFLSCPRS